MKHASRMNILTFIKISCLMLMRLDGKIMMHHYDDDLLFYIGTYINGVESASEQDSRCVLS